MVNNLITLLSAVTFFLLITIVPSLSFAQSRCLGIDDVNQINRFDHCKKGEIISVLTLMNEGEISDVVNANIAKEVFRVNEVNKFCSFDNPIVHVGDFKTDNYPVRWFDCEYIGKRRSPRLAPDKWLHPN